MNPELKLKIDQIQSLNISQEEKTAMFGKVIKDFAAQFGPPPPNNTPRDGLMGRFAMEGVNDAPADGNIRLEMSPPPPPFDTGSVSSPAGYRAGGYTFGGTTPTNLSQGTGNPRMFSPQTTPTQAQTQVPNLNAIKERMGLIGPNIPSNKILNKDNVNVHMPWDGSSPIPTMPNKYNDLSTKPQQTNPSINWQHGNVETLGGNQAPLPVLAMQKEQSRLVPPSNAQPRNITTDPNEVERNFMGMPQGGKDGRFGMTGYFDRLFNNPARMAMLSGGLTALDPSSYYDKEGFGSPWTGLKSGLGGAQAGYKSVIDRRKTEAEAAKLKAEAGSTMKGQPSSYKEFTLAKKQGYEGSYTDFLREMNKLKAGTMSPMGGAMKKIYEKQAGIVLGLQTEAEQAVIGLRNLYESKSFLDRPEGIISGPLAGIKTKFYSFLENRVGLDMGSAHANTEAFLGSMGSQVGQIIKQFGSGTGLSDADRDYAKMIVGGDIELDEDSIRELMRIQEKIYRHQISNYRSKSDPFSKGLKAHGYEGMDFSINTSDLDLKSKTDWGKRDKRRTRLGHYYYDTNGKKVKTIQPRTDIKKALSRVEREELIELKKQKEEGWGFPNPFKK